MNIVKIENLDEENLKAYYELSETQLAHYYEPHPGIFVAESPKVVARALCAGYRPISFLVEETQLAALEETLVRDHVLSMEYLQNTPIYVAKEGLLKTITGYPMTRGVLCTMERKVAVLPEELFQNARRVVLLENVENPTNIGAIFRSAAALGMDAIILSPGSADPLYRRAARVSMGTVFQIPWTYAADWEDTLQAMKKAGFHISALALRDDTVSLDELKPGPDEKLAFVLGNEGDGLPDSTLNLCDVTVKIPMCHGVDSLNVAAAAAVAFWQIR